MNIGDNVSWTHISTRGKSLSMRLRRGILINITGTKATVRLFNGKLETVAVNRLRLPGQPSQITELVEAIRGQ